MRKHFCGRMSHITLSADPDLVSWHLALSSKFSVKSLYGRLTQGAGLDVAVWLVERRIPLKVKIFLWQMFRNCLPTSDNVARRNGPSDGACAVCGAPEDANHALMFVSLRALIIIFSD